MTSERPLADGSGSTIDDREERRAGNGWKRL